ncbi:alpha-l-fucosidase [Musa troglodytarum]|uniref:Alpha-l-fucosidase n=1 Tax=Musa troglodytarum TaxID=320322 RepID=A0A9E7L7J4_9LILI|nr:alpha-l-fucosidase [Musa troglodytarum]
MDRAEPGDWVWVRRPGEADAAEWRAAAAAGIQAEDERPLKVVFTSPAAHWTDAAPLGNGRLGAMVWGGVASETIQLNAETRDTRIFCADDTLWTGVPGDYTNPDAPAVLAKVRKLVDSGDYAAASVAALGLSGFQSVVYQPLGDINLAFGDAHTGYSAYYRDIDLKTATVNVKYTIGDVEFTREHFSSNPHQVVVTKFSANKAGSLSFVVYLDSKLQHHSTVSGTNQIVMEGSCPGQMFSPGEIKSEKSSGIKFSAILDLQCGGKGSKVQVQDEGKLKVDGADWVILLLAASSSFDGPFTMPSDSKKDPTSAASNTINSIRNLSYTQLYASHLDDYQSLFNRVTLQLSKESKNALEEEDLVAVQKGHKTNPDAPRVENGNSSRSASSAISAAERVKSFVNDEDPSLVELLFHYGRYLLISCSRPGTQISNLQGIWNQDTAPAWDGAPHMNINLQMNYWPSLPCNLSECQEPLFDFIASLMRNGSKTAKVNYEASGWVAHQVTDIWAKTSPDRGDPVWALWPMGGAWLCTHLWEHYSFSMDKDFLQNTAYPLLKGCASFLLDWLIEGRGGYLETNPSTSPEHSFIAPDGKTASVSYSTTMDMAIIKEVFTVVISSEKVLGCSDSEFVQRIKKALSWLPPTRIARDGSIMEWASFEVLHVFVPLQAQDFEDPDVYHRHVSHLFGLFPGHTITIRKTPDLCKAAANSLYKRGDAGPGWSTTWKMALWARLRNSEHAYRMIKQLIMLVDPDHQATFEGGLYSNLFTAHPPFQIDANFGFAAAIAEMLVQSTDRDLYLLPALPRDKWAAGYVRGLKARGGTTVNIHWKEGQLHETWLWTTNKNSITRLHYGGHMIRYGRVCPAIIRIQMRLPCSLKLENWWTVEIMQQLQSLPSAYLVSTLVYQPLGDINLVFGDSDTRYSAYYRDIDLKTATVNVQYTIEDVEFTREHFSSNPHQVVVTKFSADKAGSLSFTVYLDSKLQHHSSVSGTSQIVIEGSCPGKIISSDEIKSDKSSGIKFSAILDLRCGGVGSKVQVLDEGKLKVDGADWVILLLAASSSFEGPFTKPSDSKKDPTSAALHTINSIRNMSYTQLYAYHLDDYQSLFNRVTLKLSKESKNALEEENLVAVRKGHKTDSDAPRVEKGKSSRSASSTISAAERVKSFINDEDPSLVDLLFHYGRYLLISCSRPGTQIANLQGIWNKDTEPAWDGAPHMNVNLQMNYWPSLPCNLSECQEPLFDFIASLVRNGSKTAKWLGGSSSHRHMGKTSPDRGDPVWALWPMGGAWLCTHLWEHYSFSMDKDFLQNTAYPLLKGCASFLLDWLIEGRGGYLETNPSTSPEHSFIAPDGKTASVSYSTTMDMAIIKEVFTVVISSDKVLGCSDSEFVQRIKKALSWLPPTRIARDGSIMEWASFEVLHVFVPLQAQDFEDPEVHHRHVSHLFGLFPGHTITIGKTPDLCKAAANSLYKRGDAGPGWSTTWKMALWARLRNSEHAYRMIKQLIILVDPDHEANFEGGLYSNLFTAHPPFQIDANFGFAAAIAEMLVQSTEHDLYILPALPRDKWTTGYVRGLKARGGTTVNIRWREGDLHETWLWTRNKNSITRLHYRGHIGFVFPTVHNAGTVGAWAKSPPTPRTEGFGCTTNQHHRFLKSLVYVVFGVLGSYLSRRHQHPILTGHQAALSLVALPRASLRNVVGQGILRPKASLFSVFGSSSSPPARFGINVTTC